MVNPRPPPNSAAQEQLRHDGAVLLLQVWLVNRLSRFRATRVRKLRHNLSAASVQRAWRTHVVQQAALRRQQAWELAHRPQIQAATVRVDVACGLFHLPCAHPYPNCVFRQCKHCAGATPLGWLRPHVEWVERKRWARMGCETCCNPSGCGCASTVCCAACTTAWRA